MKMDNSALPVTAWPHHESTVNVRIANADVRWRQRLGVAQVVSDKLTVSGMYFNLPSTAKIVQAGSTYALNYDLWSPSI